MPATAESTALTSRPSQWKDPLRPLDGRRIIVTGGTTGLGRTITLLLAHLGADVVICGRRQTHIDEAMQDLADVADKVHTLEADMSKEDDVDALFAFADEKLGGLDVLINNAGVGAGTVEDSEPVEYRYVVETNLLGYMACAKRAIERLGGGTSGGGGGDIINIGSLSAKSRGEGSDVYVATKAGIRGWSEALGKQLQEDRIRVTCLEPGKIGADFRYQPHDEQHEEHADGELLYSESIAEAVWYLLIQPKTTNIPLLQVQPVENQIND